MSRLATDVAKMWLKSELGGLQKNASIGACHICLEYGNTDIPDSWFPLQCIPCFYRFETSFLHRSVVDFFVLGRAQAMAGKASIKKIPRRSRSPNGPHKSPWRELHIAIYFAIRQPTAMISSRPLNRSVHRSRSNRWLGGASFFAGQVAGGWFSLLGDEFSSPENRGNPPLRQRLFVPKKV